MRLVIYDYGDNKLRTRVCNDLKVLGRHVQWSVFELGEDISLKRVREILKRKEEEDRVAVFRVSRNGKIYRLGRPWNKMKFVV